MVGVEIIEKLDKLSSWSREREGREAFPFF